MLTIQQNLEQINISENSQSQASTSQKPGIFFEEDPDTDPEDFYVPKSTSRSSNKHSQSPIRRKICPKRKLLELVDQFQDVVQNKQQQQPNNEQEEVPFEQKIEKLFMNLKHFKDFLYKPTKHNAKTTIYLTVTKSLGCKKFIGKILFEGKTVYLATKKRSITEAKYEISLLPDFVEDIQSEPFFVGSMIHEHSIFEVTDDGRFPVHYNQMIKRRVASIYIENELFSGPKIVLITPKIRDEEMCTIEANSASEFVKLLSLSIQSTPLQKYSNLKQSKSDIQNLNREMGCRSSKKNIIVKNTEKDNYAMILGRVNDIEYKLDLIEGLSPFQAFCLFVAWLD